MVYTTNIRGVEYVGITDVLEKKEKGNGFYATSIEYEQKSILIPLEDLKELLAEIKNK